MHRRIHGLLWNDFPSAMSQGIKEGGSYPAFPKVLVVVSKGRELSNGAV